jgi:hypothetical protein
MVYPDGDNHLQGDGIEDFLDMSGSKSIMTGFHEIRLGRKKFHQKRNPLFMPIAPAGKMREHASRLGKTERADPHMNKRAILQTPSKGFVFKKRADFLQFLT